MATIGALTALTAVAVEAWITAQATEPLRQLTAAARRSLPGNYDRKPPAPTTVVGEYGVIARALSEANTRSPAASGSSAARARRRPRCSKA